jgi:two-component system, LytTR family, response regulator AgrA
MKVVICEDNEMQLSYIQRVIENYAMMEDNGIEIVLATSNPDDIVQFIETEQADCYFLDIDLNHEMTGIVLGDMLRKQDPICSIIFVTTHAEMTYLTFMYKIAALDFIIKDQAEQMQYKILDTLKTAHQKYKQIGQQQVSSKIQIKTNGQARNIDITSIYFLEASPILHKVILHLENEYIEFYGRLKDFEQIHEQLYRCHKAFIVNRAHIERVDYKERIVYLKNGETCFASARLIKGLKE